ncbi:MAG: hypothetical protein QUV05_24005 [Phycisphaerae bacterium]|nr:hypothetical protein [Phycisphaerae bacterium]
MWHAVRSWSWRLLLIGGLLFALMGAECGEGGANCEDIDDLSDWFNCVGNDIEDWF